MQGRGARRPPEKGAGRPTKAAGRSIGSSATTAPGSIVRRRRLRESETTGTVSSLESVRFHSRRLRSRRAGGKLHRQVVAGRGRESMARTLLTALVTTAQTFWNRKGLAVSSDVVRRSDNIPSRPTAGSTHATGSSVWIATSSATSGAAWIGTSAGGSQWTASCQRDPNARFAGRAITAEAVVPISISRRPVRSPKLRSKICRTYRSTLAHLLPAIEEQMI
jgi:hypothetical protein